MDIVELTADEHIASLPDGVRQEMDELDRAISNVMAGTIRRVWQGKMWGGTAQTIIGYGNYKYERKGIASEWFVIGLAAQKNYLSLYVNVAEDGGYLAKKWADRLGKVKIGSSSVSFKRLDDVDRPALIEFLNRARELHEAT